VERQRVIWYESDNPNGFRTGQQFSIDEPCLSIMAAGLGGDSYGHWHFRTDGRADQTVTSSKPAFQPLTMAQVTRTPLSGLTHVSTFSGAGGTCLGFRMAGFRTLWANDIDEHACACYSANLDSPIDSRDLRQLTAADILTATGLPVGALDVFEGSPPCTAFSTAGKRAKGWGQTKDHAGHVQANVEDLFFDWLRLLDGLRPRAFVAENVAGLVKGVAKGYFKDILRQMKALGYATEARLIDAQWLGVPQQRSRIIFIGIREDLGALPTFPTPWSYRYTVRDALPWISNAALSADRIIGQQVVTSGFTRETKTLDDPAPALVANSAEFGGQFITASGGRRPFTINELKRICSFPDDYVMTGSYPQQWARLGNSVPPLMAKAIGDAVRDTLLAVSAPVAHASRR
jgi:DNA (cytosine-5)-methyltransferase 1